MTRWHAQSEGVRNRSSELKLGWVCSVVVRRLFVVCAHVQSVGYAHSDSTLGAVLVVDLPRRTAEANGPPDPRPNGGCSWVLPAEPADSGAPGDEGVDEARRSNGRRPRAPMTPPPLGMRRWARAGRVPPLGPRWCPFGPSGLVTPPPNRLPWLRPRACAAGEEVEEDGRGEWSGRPAAAWALDGGGTTTRMSREPVEFDGDAEGVGTPAAAVVAASCSKYVWRRDFGMRMVARSGSSSTSWREFSALRACRATSVSDEPPTLTPPKETCTDAATDGPPDRATGGCCFFVWANSD